MKKLLFILAACCVFAFCSPVGFAAGDKPLIQLSEQLTYERVVLTWKDGQKTYNNQLSINGPAGAPIYAGQEGIVLSKRVFPDSLSYPWVDYYFQDGTVITLGGNLSDDIKVGDVIPAGGILAKVGSGVAIDDGGEDAVHLISISASKYNPHNKVDSLAVLDPENYCGIKK